MFYQFPGTSTHFYLHTLHFKITKSTDQVSQQYLQVILTKERDNHACQFIIIPTVNAGRLIVMSQTSYLKNWLKAHRNIYLQLLYQLNNQNKNILLEFCPIFTQLENKLKKKAITSWNPFHYVIIYNSTRADFHDTF